MDHDDWVELMAERAGWQGDPIEFEYSDEYPGDEPPGWSQIEDPRPRPARPQEMTFRQYLLAIIVGIALIAFMILIYH